MYNVPLLEAVRDMVAAENGLRHEQGLWASIKTGDRKVLDTFVNDTGERFVKVSCPTTACVAGWAATLSGAKLLVEAFDYQDHSTVSASAVLTPEGDVRAISGYARQRLGLTIEEADALFCGSGTTEEVLEALDDIIMAAKHGQKWEIRHYGSTSWREFAEGDDD